MNEPGPASGSSPPIADADTDGADVDGRQREDSPYLADLKKRAPTVRAVLQSIKSSSEYEFLSQDNEFFSSEEDMGIFFDEEFWSPVNDSIIRALDKCCAAKASQVARKTIKYSDERRKILEDVTDHAPFGIDSSPEMTDEGKCIFYLIADNYFEIFHRYLSKGTTDNVEAKVSSLLNDPDFIPTDKVLSENMCFVFGWLLSASSKASARRSDKEGVGKALHALSMNRVDSKDTAAMKKAKDEDCLPYGRIERVESFGGMAYPNLLFYKFMCMIEHVCANMITPEILTLHGGSLLFKVMNTLLHDSYVYSQFKPLIESYQDASDDEIKEALRYLLRTYSRMRGKDLMRRLVGLLKKSDRVGHRQTMAAKADKKSKKKKKTTTKGKGKGKSKKGDESEEKDDNGNTSNKGKKSGEKDDDANGTLEELRKDYVEMKQIVNDMEKEDEEDEATGKVSSRDIVSEMLHEDDPAVGNEDE